MSFLRGVFTAGGMMRCGYGLWFPRYLIVAMVSSPITASCAPVTIKLAKVEVVDLKDQQVTLWSEWLREKAPSRMVVKIAFSADADLVELARGGATSGTVDVVRIASICEGDDVDGDKDLGGDPSVYTPTGKLDGNTDKLVALDRGGDESGNYHVFVNLKSSSLANGSNGFRYDLEKTPQNICVKLVGRTMLPSLDSFDSTTVKISKVLLSSAAQAKQKQMKTF